ncbi:MAG: hypothetical protein KJP12_03705, partial [Acidimicrobiia bacterium]|nr:hypothetical protein [Acidimicrobiia bacterium]
MSITRSAAVRRKLTIVWAVALVASIAAGPVITNGSAFGNEEPTETPTVEAEAATGGDSTGTVTATSDGATASGTTGTTPTISDGYAFTFTFLHTDGTTSVLSGTSESNVGFLPSAGGSTVPGTGMDVHVSCSDAYPDGWGEKDGPVEGVDTEWRVQSYVVEKYKDGVVDKSCGDAFSLSAATAATTDWSNEDWSEYTFEFGDGTIITGSNRSDGDGYTGDKNQADLGLSETVHVSCSDDFNLDKTSPAENGWGDKGAPVFGVDPAPVVSYSIDKYKDGEWDKTCADSTILIPTDPLPELSIDLEKFVMVDGGSFVDADAAPGPDAVYGTDVFFRFDVTNTGEVDLGGLKLTDTDYSTASCDLGSSLAP